MNIYIYGMFRYALDTIYLAHYMHILTHRLCTTKCEVVIRKRKIEKFSNMDGNGKNRQAKLLPFLIASCVHTPHTPTSLKYLNRNQTCKHVPLVMYAFLYLFFFRVLAMFLSSIHVWYSKKFLPLKMGSIPYTRLLLYTTL